jgi:site-specific DNA-methyltransferase (adenine-specific)
MNADFISDDGKFILYNADCISVMSDLEDNMFDMIFADPPYFLSDGGTTCKNGKRESVDKGKWDSKLSTQAMHEFNKQWLEQCQRLLKPNGTIWVSGTHHNIFSVGYAMQELDYKVLNEITWQKPNPPPNLACRYFTHSTETIIWAAKNKKSKHVFNYDDMKKENNNKQMKSVWAICAPGKSEKECGKHPTQKPLALLERIIKASTNENDLILDPFAGSSTTGIAAVKLNRKFVGIELEKEFFNLSKLRFGV